MTHGNGHRRRCPECGQSVEHLRDVLATREVRGPRQITSSNIDRAFDDAGKRFLLIEEKGPNEPVGKGQWQMLRHLAALPCVDVWGVRGTPNDLSISSVHLDSPPNPIVPTGDMTDYQRQVEAWFQSPPPYDWERHLDVLGGMPFTAPEWCPEDDWGALDKALTVVRRHRSRQPSSLGADKARRHLESLGRSK